VIYQWFNDISFLHPAAFILLAILPVLIWWKYYKSARSRAVFTVSQIPVVHESSSWKKIIWPLPFIFRLLAIICLITAIARPVKRNQEQLISGEGIDIVLCMDVSGSMLAEDCQPNRLEAMKNVAAEFVDKRITDRIAVVVFAGESFTLSPLTTDKAILKSHIYSASGNYLADGTAIGDGLTTSVERLRESKAKSKVIIFLTDGEDQGGRIDPLTAMEIARNYSIKVYTIGMGTEGYAQAPVQTSSGRIVMQRQKVNLNEELLRRIAAETGGLYFRAKGNEGLEEIYEEIDNLEKSNIEITNFIRIKEEYIWPLFAGLIFIVLEVFLKFVVLRKFP